MDLVTLNQLIYDEFHRITGSTNRFHFPAWFAEISRRAVANLHEESPRAAAAIWGRLTKVEQRDYLLQFLRAQPPAHWPDLRLVVERAYAAAGARGKLQAILDGVDQAERAA